jgi:hypothetical protein
MRASPQYLTEAVNINAGDIRDERLVNGSSGTPFTCIISTKVQILTPGELSGIQRSLNILSDPGSYVYMYIYIYIHTYIYIYIYIYIKYIDIYI